MNETEIIWKWEVRASRKPDALVIASGHFQGTKDQAMTRAKFDAKPGNVIALRRMRIKGRST